MVVKRSHGSGRLQCSAGTRSPRCRRLAGTPLSHSGTCQQAPGPPPACGVVRGGAAHLSNSRTATSDWKILLRNRLSYASPAPLRLCRAVGTRAGFARGRGGFCFGRARLLHRQCMHACAARQWCSNCCGRAGGMRMGVINYASQTPCQPHSPVACRGSRAPLLRPPRPRATCAAAVEGGRGLRRRKPAWTHQATSC